MTPPGAPFVLCPYTLSEVVCALRTPEALFTSDELNYTETMAWTGDGLAIGVQFFEEGVEPRWGVAATKGTTAEVVTLWELPVWIHPEALVPTPEGLFVVAKPRASLATGGLLRLLPDGSYKGLFELPYSGLGYVERHPIVFADGRLHALIRRTPLGWESRPTQIAAGGGELQVFDFVTQYYGLVDGGFVGVSPNRGSCSEDPGCTHPPLFSLALRRHDPKSGTTSTIQSKVCITAKPPLRSEFFGVGVHAGGIVVDDGALVNIGFDGSHRVIAALTDDFDEATLQDEWIYFVSRRWTQEGELEFQALRRVALQGGPVEELVRFTDASISIGTFDGDHVYLDHATNEKHKLLRIAL